MGLKTAQLVQRTMWMKESSRVIASPEMYGGAGGEMLVFAMIISWILTGLFNYRVIQMNPLKDRVGYNNLCVGWDEAPARYLAAPMFALTVYFNIRFMVLSIRRQNLTEGATKSEKAILWCACMANILSFAFSTLIFVIRPSGADVNPFYHTLSFVQLVVFQYIVYVANFITTDSEYHIQGSYIFIPIFGIISFGFGILAMIQMSTFELEMFNQAKEAARAKGFYFDVNYLDYHEITQNKTMTDATMELRAQAAEAARGPVPWWLMCAFDYLWFAAMALQGHFRPRAPSISQDFELVPDDDFRDVDFKHFKSEEQTEESEAVVTPSEDSFNADGDES